MCIIKPGKAAGQPRFAYRHQPFLLGVEQGVRVEPLYTVTDCRAWQGQGVYFKGVAKGVGGDAVAVHATF